MNGVRMTMFDDNRLVTSQRLSRSFKDVADSLAHMTRGEAVIEVDNVLRTKDRFIQAQKIPFPDGRVIRRVIMLEAL
jgi:hypothetical protein